MEKYFDNNADFLYSANEAFDKVDVVLDIGCGIKPQHYIKPLVHICCEPYQEYVNIICEEFPKKLVIKEGWQDIIEMFPPKSVDTIFLLDIIEHLEKEDGRKLLEKTLTLARNQVIIFTPLGFMPQHHENGTDAWGLHGVDWQEHRSGWDQSDFTDDWDLYICKDFHKTDNLERKLEKPHGAFFAIWNNPNKTNNQSYMGSYIDALQKVDKKFQENFLEAIARGNTLDFEQLIHFLYKNYANDKWGMILSATETLEYGNSSGIEQVISFLCENYPDNERWDIIYSIVFAKAKKLTIYSKLNKILKFASKVKRRLKIRS